MRTLRLTAGMIAVGSATMLVAACGRLEPKDIRGAEMGIAVCLGVAVCTLILMLVLLLIRAARKRGRDE